MAGPVNINIKPGQEQKGADAPRDRHKRAPETAGFLMHAERQLPADILVVKDLKDTAF